ncbi:MAG: type II toxin-antitoxin system RelB/DinJ family antitoxin [Clostridia bacterium]|nr:type II toxin-antitoxin system RelB/DinJ family antitoxin [Clostridia bacterium]
MSSTVSTQIRIDKETKDIANKIFKELGIDMSTAVNIFLRQCIMHDGLPFSVEISCYSKETLDAAEEARRISRDPSTPSYTDINELKEALLK